MIENIDKRILFVDDEPRVLRAIRRGLRGQSKKWHLSFAENAAEALELMKADSFDIVVSDVTMPRMDGALFLRRVRETYPDTIRILMSGTAHGEAIMRSVPVAHRFLSKPWNVTGLLHELNRAFDLRAQMGQGAIRTIVGGIASLPVLPPVYEKLCGLLEDPKSRLDDIVRVVETDPAVVARLLHIVNSAFFAPPRPLHSVGDTVRYLGTSLPKSLLLTTEIFSAFDPETLPAGFSLDQLQTHALLTAKTASCMVEVEKDQAMCAGLLHSIGTLIFADRMPQRWGEALRQAREEGRAIADVEFEHFETTYADVGGYLLGLWGLPQELVEAVANHCDPMRSRSSGLNLVAVTHLASVLAAQELGMTDHSFDEELLESLDGARSLDAWRGMTSSIAQK